MDLVEEICQLLIERYSISAILGHEEISPGRKSDPGPAFPLDVLRYRLLEMDRAEDEEKPAAAPAATTTKAFGVVTASKLNIRSGPSLSAETVASPLTGGTFVDILQEKDGWYEVEARIRGWVKKDYVKR
ncbi:MAG: SH3 domain-containing protein [Calditrichia bacterium]